VTKLCSGQASGDADNDADTDAADKSNPYMSPFKAADTADKSYPYMLPFKATQKWDEVELWFLVKAPLTGQYQCVKSHLNPYNSFQFTLQTDAQRDVQSGNQKFHIL
jgi:hypothetical protein